MPDVVMPRLSDSMEEGTVLRWLKADGDEVHKGEELVEIETDKATMTYESDLEGVLRIVAQEGTTLPIGEVIAIVGASNGASAAPATAAPAPAAPAPVPVPEPPAPRVSAPAGDGADPGRRIKASPLARRLAGELGVALAAVTGTGPGGRIVRADVEAAAASGPAPAAPEGAQAVAAPAPVPERAIVAPPVAAPAPAPAELGTAKGDVTIQELSRTQLLVARRMAESKATVPDFTLQTDVDMEGCVALRADLKELDRAVVPTYNDMVVRACAIALREYPRANGSYRDGHFELYSRVNVGVAVAAQDSLLVPTVFDADLKSLTAIAGETRALAGRVRDGSITPPELSGGTFTVSNLGMYGITSFTAVINSPQAAILSVGSLVARPVVHEGQVTVRHVMPVTLACDHRILYGADAAEFLARIRALLERPLGLAL